MGEAVDRVVRLATVSVAGHLRGTEHGVTKVDAYTYQRNLLQNQRAAVLQKNFRDIQKANAGNEVLPDSSYRGFTVADDDTLFKTGPRGTAIVKRRPGEGWEVRTKQGEFGNGPTHGHGTYETLEVATMEADSLLSDRRLMVKLFGLTRD